MQDTYSSLTKEVRAEGKAIGNTKDILIFNNVAKWKESTRAVASNEMTTTPYSTYGRH